MSARHRVAMTYLLMAADVCTLVVSFILATLLRFGNFRGMEDSSTHFGACAIFVVITLLFLLVTDQNRDFLQRGVPEEIYKVLRMVAAVAVAGLVILYALHTIDTISRLVIGYFFLLAFVLTLIVHLILRRAMLAYWRTRGNSSQVLVVAERAVLEESLRRLSRSLDVTRRIVGAVCTDEDMSGQEIEGTEILMNRDDLIGRCTTMVLDEVFFCVPNMPQRTLSELICAFHEMGVTVHCSMGLSGVHGGDTNVGMFGNYSVISYQHTTGRHRGLVIKRLTDIVGSLVGLLITAILTPFIAIAIRVDSPGPVLFSQTRVGRNGRRFRIFKFRSMYTDAEERKEELQEQNEMDGPIFKIQNDPRITRVGAFLRKTSLDELPQFYNVLRGDMSLVGTRPPTEDEFERYDQHYRRRLSMTPGLTGLWQVNGRSRVESFDEIVRYDLEYIDHWSLKLDLKILCKTVGVVLFGRGAS